MKKNPDEPDPLNLRKLYGDKYKITLDESAFCPGESKKNPWYFQVACKYGVVYPYSNKELAFYCESQKIRDRLHREHPEIKVVNWSDDGEAIFIFDPKKFDLIANYAWPRKRRRLSEEHKKKLINSSLCFRFKSKNHGSEERKRVESKAISGG
jgi:hypothetical protein